MKKAYRIKKEREFQHVYHHAQTYANRQLVLYVYPKPEQAHFRVGLSVGKRIGNAVMRNKVKRYLRQSLQDLEHEIPHEYDYLLIARPHDRCKVIIIPFIGGFNEKFIAMDESSHAFGLANLLSGLRCHIKCRRQQ